MVSFISFCLILYVVYTINISCLTMLIEHGYFENPFWTRSLRACFITPPFAIAIVMVIALKDSIKTNWENIKVIMKKREV